jgi:predicted RNase H-like HicB family nuclease
MRRTCVSLTRTIHRENLDEALKKLLEALPKTDEAPRLPKPAFAGIYAQLKTIQNVFAEGKATVEKQDIEQLIADLEAFCTLLKEQARKQDATTEASASATS